MRSTFRIAYDAPVVVPAKAGTHTPRPPLQGTLAIAFFYLDIDGYGSLLSQGRPAGRSRANENAGAKPANR
jgi:hypothetical protein